MNPALAQLRPYPFERLRALLAGAQAARGSAAHFAVDRRAAPCAAAVRARRADRESRGLWQLSDDAGLPQLRAAAAAWLTRRFQLPAGSVDPETMVLPVNGTREALFAFVQAVVDAARAPLVVMPNPFYQIYEGAALLAGAEPYFHRQRSRRTTTCRISTACRPKSGSAASCCSCARRAIRPAQLPASTTCAARSSSPIATTSSIASDECYSEIYLDEAQSAAGPAAGRRRGGPRRLRALRRLSQPVEALERAGPALRFRRRRRAADQVVPALSHLSRLRDAAADAAREHRGLERRCTTWSRTGACIAQKFATVLPILREVLEVDAPEASFYLWPRVADDERFTRQLFERQHVTVLPGSYIARDTPHGNPGRGRVRISLVATVPECVEAAERIRDLCSRARATTSDGDLR